MAFLKLNGYTVPVVTKGSAEDTISGFDGEMSIDGTPMRDRQNTRRQWSFETPPMDDDDAEGLVGLIQGRGQSFPYTSDLYSAAGHGPSGTPVATIIPGNDLQSSPKRVYLESTGELEAKFWGDALEMGPAATNILSENVRTADNAPTGYAIFSSGTIASESTIVLQGTKSLKVTNGATAYGGGQTGYATTTELTAYTVSVYIYATSVLNLRVNAVDNNGGLTINQINTIANAWIRVSTTHTTVAGSTGLKIVCAADNDATPMTWYCDAWQIETGSTATPWYNGTRGNPSLYYTGLTEHSDNLTFAAWVRPPTSNPSATCSLLYVTDDTDFTNGLILQRQSASNNIRLGTKTESVGSWDYTTYATTPWDDEWHHIAVTCSARTLGGYRKIVVYYDGAAIITKSAEADYPEFRGETNTIYIGNDGGTTSYWRGPIQDVQVLPYALSADQVAGLASRTTITPGLPLLDATGAFDSALQDSTREYTHKVIGSVSKVDYAGGVYSGTYRSYGKKVYFDLLARDRG